MIRALEHFPAGHWPESEASGTLTLDFDARHRRRIRLDTDEGDAVLLDLEKPVAMGDGDGLRCEDGRWLAVRAAPEKLAEIVCADAAQLVRVAWHFGNRHLPTQLCGETLRIRPDHVIEAMAEGLGATVRHIEAPFQPEGGAYGGHSHGGGHDHHHDHDHEHQHLNGHGHAH